MKQVIFIYCVLINIITFVVYGYDKRQARKNHWRVSEMTLLGLSFLGGSVGALGGMYFFHHKTKHWKFKICNPLFLLLHVLIILL